MALSEQERAELEQLRARAGRVEESARERAERPPARNPSRLANVGRSVLQGASFGFGDEAVAGIRSMLGEDYSSALEDERANLAEYGRAHPWLSTGTELAGGVLTGGLLGGARAGLARGAQRVLPGVVSDAGRALGSRFASLPVVAQGAILGGGTAGVTGFGQGEGGTGERLENAVQSAPYGVALGAAVPAAMALGRGAINALRTPPAAKAERKILDRMRASNLTPDQLEYQLQADRALGVPSTIAAQSENLTNLGEGVANIPGRGMEVSRQAIEQAHRGQGERISRALAQRTGGGDYVQKAADIDDVFKRQATPLYDRAYAVDVNMMGSDVAEQLQRVPKDELAKAFDAAKRVYASDRANAGRPMREFMTFRRDSEGNVVDAIFPVDMNTREWHAFIRGLREVKDGLFRNNAAHARNIDDVYKTVDRIGKDRNTLFRDAQRVYSDTKSIEEAMQSGRDAMRSLRTPAEMRKEIANLSANEQAHYRAGAVQFLDEQLARQKDGANMAASLVNTGHIRNKLRAITPDPNEYELLIATLQTEARDAARRSQMTQGSPTGRRTEAIRDVKGEDEFLPQVGEAIQGPTQFARRWLATQATRLGTSRGTSDELAPMLHATDPADQASILQRLRNRQTALEQEAAQASEMYRAGAAGAGAAAASQPYERRMGVERE